MSKLKFLFGSHCHQPVGNFDHVFADALEGAYLPFFRELEQFPDVRMSVHFSGPLLEWIEGHDGTLIELLASLVERNQIEMLSSGFYEPVLAAIPERDRAGQLAMMNSWLEERLGAHAGGAWMTERVWEPQVVGSLVKSGLGYVVIDDYHFKSAGIAEGELDGYYVTEEDGRRLAIFPISEALRYTIPFQDPQRSIEHLARARDAGKKVVVMMDDGEKFGVWPGTRDLSYKQGWLRRFFAALQENSDWLETATPADVLASQPPTGMVYLPTASYFEMGEWTLPAEKAEQFAGIVHELQDSGRIERFRPFLRGGIWRNFFSKYPESNNMHKRMLSLSARIELLREAHGPEVLEDATRELYRAQCNCAYWHGVFGGLYLTHLRHAIYRHLIAAQQEADKVEFTNGVLPAVAREDINFDGVPEIVLRSDTITAIAAPRYGGALFELDYAPLHFNLLDTLASRREGYHSAFDAPQQESGGGDTPSIHDIARRPDDTLRANLRYDWHNRYSLLDHCLDPGTTLEAMRERSFRELGDFVNQPYKVEVEEGSVSLSREGSLFTNEGIIPLRISKRLTLDGDELSIEYTLENRSARPADFLFAPEFNFSMLGGGDEEVTYTSAKSNDIGGKMDSAGETPEITDYGIDDRRRGLEIRLALDRPAPFWYFPAHTISQSESGFELNYQSSVIIPHRRLAIPAGGKERFGVKLTLSKLR